MTLTDQGAVDLAETIPARQTAIKQECTAHILAAYPEPIQRSAAMGIYSSDVIDKIKVFIARCVEEENRCYDLLEIATTIEAVGAVTPKFPEA